MRILGIYIQHDACAAVFDDYRLIAAVAQEQPVYLTSGPETPNGAGVRFLVDGAEVEAFEGFVRIVCLFDGNDDDAVAKARAQWTAAKAAGCPVTYWQQSAAGKWEKKA